MDVIGRNSEIFIALLAAMLIEEIWVKLPIHWTKIGNTILSKWSPILPKIGLFSHGPWVQLLNTSQNTKYVRIFAMHSMPSLFADNCQTLEYFGHAISIVLVNMSLVLKYIPIFYIICLFIWAKIWLVLPCFTICISKYGHILEINDYYWNYI